MWQNSAYKLFCCKFPVSWSAEVVQVSAKFGTLHSACQASSLQLETCSCANDTKGSDQALQHSRMATSRYRLAVWNGTGHLERLATKYLVWPQAWILLPGISRDTAGHRSAWQINCFPERLQCTPGHLVPGGQAQHGNRQSVAGIFQCYHFY